MNSRVLRVLEYDKIVGQLTALAVSPAGASLCAELVPVNDIHEMQYLLALTNAADEVWTRLGGNAMEYFENIAESAQRWAIGAIPSVSELYTSSRTLKAMRQVKERLIRGNAEQPLSMFVDDITAFPAIESEIDRCLLNEEELHDDASASLRQIRRAIRTTVDKIRSRLHQIISGSNYKNMLQDALITMRNGRYVVPVKAEYASAVKGLEHGRSSTGATVFIEPLSVLEANNELRQLEAEEKSEIERILASLGQMIGSQAHEIGRSIKAMAEIDRAFAKAAWGRRQKAVCPQVHEGDHMQIIGARHPLIPAENVVPVDITCGGDIRALIITGPNTGGKTVTIKTAGLFALLAQSGLFLPCKSAKIPCYSQVFADIGDEQSIEQSLSTFSSHMVNIVNILKHVSGQTLVLVDELGVGTDPAEGAALAIAIIEELTAKQACVIATTHYSELKSYAMRMPGYVNAGMEFDVVSLRPTYRLITGAAGSSNAFEIGLRLGLPEQVIDNARNLVGEEDKKMQEALDAVEKLRLEAESVLKQREEEARNERLNWANELATLRAELEQQRKKSERFLIKAQKTLDQAKEAVDEAIESARKAARAENNAERERYLQSARVERRKLREIELAAPEGSEEPEAEERPPKELLPGDTVRIKSFDTPVTVLSKPDSKGEMMVQAGIMRLTVKADDAVWVPSPKQKKASFRVKRDDRTAATEVDVRGMTVEEAVMVVDLHIDSTLMAGLKTTSIIHGKGTGALRNGLRLHLRNHPSVATFRPGAFGEGEDGVTIIELK